MKENTFNKGIMTLMLLMLICFVSCKEDEAFQQTDVVINLTKAGTLPNKISQNKMYHQITSLKIVGEINGTDLCFIRDASRFSNTLSILDLSEARIVEGGKAYCREGDNYYYTSNNKLGDYIFDACSPLKNIYIPLSVTEIGKYAFWGCDSLTSIYIPSSVAKIGEWAFRYCESLTSITISSDVTDIGKYAFCDCSSLKSVSISTGVTEIKEGTFSDCSSLKSVEIPSSVTKIGDIAFDGCNSLSSIRIPSSVTSIGCQAFQNCKSLNLIYVYAKKVPSTGLNSPYRIASFGGCDSKNCFVYVPKGTYDAYKRSEFGYFEHIIEFDANSMHKTIATAEVKDTSSCVMKK